MTAILSDANVLMHYFSTNRKSPHVSFREAVLQGQPDDKGLYFPTVIPAISKGFIDSLADLSNVEIAFETIKPFVDGNIPDDVLFGICSETVDFDFPLIEINDRVSSLELFHGPTLAFKDVGARFMSRCLRYFSRGESEKTIVIVATSGDTGGAVAAGFHGVEGVEVVILFPKGKVSKVQELQLTTFGGNVTTLELHGSFDDCQELAKTALADPDLRSRAWLTSANSINVARWLPQQFYYFYALKQWSGDPPVIAVPSGNFGNLAAGVLAFVRGLPVKSFIAACNANDVVPEFMRTGEYRTKPSVSTISNAMDVGAPSNFVRILELFAHEDQSLGKMLNAVSINDEVTVDTMREVHEKYGYTLDPHGAVGYRALADHLESSPGDRGIFLETAHPVKFDVVDDIIGTATPVPETVAGLYSRPKSSIEIEKSYDQLKDILLSKI